MTDDGNEFEGFRVVEGGDLGDDEFAAPGRSVFGDDVSFDDDDDVIPHWSEPPTGSVPQVGVETGGVTFEPAPEPTLAEAEPDETGTFGFFDPIEGEEGFRLSEDYSFCERWIRFGQGEVWCNIEDPIGHFGSHGFQGRFLESLMSAPRD